MDPLRRAAEHLFVVDWVPADADPGIEAAVLDRQKHLIIVDEAFIGSRLLFSDSSPLLGIA